MGRPPFVFLLALLTGCASTAPWTGRDIRLADDTPTAFITEDGAPPEQVCRSPLIDPRDNARLRLMRSAPIGGVYQGDYEVPSGRYGVAANELLRIDCASGAPVGVVPN